MTITDIFASDPRIVEIVQYDAGWVPNSYRYRCPRVATVHHRDGSTSTRTYDAKRSGGRGPAWAAFSAAGGRLASGH